MSPYDNIIYMIRESVKSTEPKATIILYGSYARRNYKHDSDLDILVLLEKDMITRDDEKK